MLPENNMQHRIFNQSFVAQVVPQGLLNVQFMVPVDTERVKELNGGRVS